MITKVEAIGYQCLRDVKQTLKPFQILVGPNGSGKSAFLDAIAFVRDVVKVGVQEAVLRRTRNFYDLVWGRSGKGFSLAVEFDAGTVDRYAMDVELGPNGDSTPRLVRRSSARAQGTLELVGTTKVLLTSSKLRQPSPHGSWSTEYYDGSEFALKVALLANETSVFESWIRHIQTAIPDLVGIRLIDQADRYIMVQYSGGVEVPQWMVSDGTLRLLALTILAYLPGPSPTYLIEEPEVGLHPTAIETVMQSLSSVYDGQVLITSHSPIVLGIAQPDQLLCFQKGKAGTVVTPGEEHPLLKDWKAGVDISALYAAGVLG